MKKATVFELGDRAYELRLNHRAIRIAESVIEDGVIGLANQLNKGESFKLSDIWALIWACINVQNNRITFDKFLDMLEDKKLSVIELNGIAVTLLVESLFAGDTPEEKPEEDNSKN